MFQFRLFLKSGMIFISTSFLISASEIDKSCNPPLSEGLQLPKLTTCKTDKFVWSGPTELGEYIAKLESIVESDIALEDKDQPEVFDPYMKEDLASPMMQERVKQVHKQLLLYRNYQFDWNLMIRELVANSLDAHDRLRVKQNVEVTIPTGENDQGDIIVKDFGDGLTLRDINLYLLTFDRSKAERSKGNIGEFGQGFFSILNTLRQNGDKITLKTKGEGGCSYDVELFFKDGKYFVQVAPQVTTQKDPGTTIVIHSKMDSKQRNEYAATVKRIFRFKSDPEVYLNGESVTHFSPEEPTLSITVKDAVFIDIPLISCPNNQNYRIALTDLESKTPDRQTIDFSSPPIVEELEKIFKSLVDNKNFECIQSLNPLFKLSPAFKKIAFEYFEKEGRNSNTVFVPNGHYLQFLDAIGEDRNAKKVVHLSAEVGDINFFKQLNTSPIYQDKKFRVIVADWDLTKHKASFAFIEDEFNEEKVIFLHKNLSEKFLANDEYQKKLLVFFFTLFKAQKELTGRSISWPTTESEKSGNKNLDQTNHEKLDVSIIEVPYIEYGNLKLEETEYYKYVQSNTGNLKFLTNNLKIFNYNDGYKSFFEFMGNLREFLKKNQIEPNPMNEEIILLDFGLMFKKYPIDPRKMFLDVVKIISQFKSILLNYELRGLVPAGIVNIYEKNKEIKDPSYQDFLNNFSRILNKHKKILENYESEQFQELKKLSYVPVSYKSEIYEDISYEFPIEFHKNYINVLIYWLKKNSLRHIPMSIRYVFLSDPKLEKLFFNTLTKFEPNDLETLYQAINVIAVIGDLLSKISLYPDGYKQFNHVFELILSRKIDLSLTQESLSEILSSLFNSNLLAEDLKKENGKVTNLLSVILESNLSENAKKFFFKLFYPEISMIPVKEENQKNNTISSLSNSLEDLVSFPFMKILGEDPQLLEKKIRKAVNQNKKPYAFLAEFLKNAEEAKAKNVHLNISYQGDEIVMRIEDDGFGIGADKKIEVEKGESRGIPYLMLPLSSSKDEENKSLDQNMGQGFFTTFSHFENVSIQTKVVNEIGEEASMKWDPIEKKMKASSVRLFDKKNNGTFFELRHKLRPDEDKYTVALDLLFYSHLAVQNIKRMKIFLNGEELNGKKENNKQLPRIREMKFETKEYGEVHLSSFINQNDALFYNDKHFGDGFAPFWPTTPEVFTPLINKRRYKLGVNIEGNLKQNTGRTSFVDSGPYKEKIKEFILHSLIDLIAMDFSFDEGSIKNEFGYDFFEDFSPKKMQIVEDLHISDDLLDKYDELTSADVARLMMNRKIFNISKNRSHEKKISFFELKKKIKEELIKNSQMNLKDIFPHVPSTVLESFTKVELIKDSNKETLFDINQLQKSQKEYLEKFKQLIIYLGENMGRENLDVIFENSPEPFVARAYQGNQQIIFFNFRVLEKWFEVLFSNSDSSSEFKRKEVMNEIIETFTHEMAHQNEKPNQNTHDRRFFDAQDALVNENLDFILDVQDNFPMGIINNKALN